MFFNGLFISILLLSVSGTPAQDQNQSRLHSIPSSSGNLCSSPEPTEVTQNLIDRLEKETAATCDCNANVTDCLCLPVPSNNCSTSCFQYGLKKMSQTLKPIYGRTIFKVQRYVSHLRSLSCKTQEGDVENVILTLKIKTVSCEFCPPTPIENHSLNICQRIPDQVIVDVPSTSKPFSCYQPCNETFTANTMEFLKILQENFQKVPISNN